MPRGKWTEQQKRDRSKAYRLMYKQHPEYKRRIDRGVSKFWDKHPGIRKIYSDVISRFWTKKERRKQSLRKKKLYRNNPRLIHEIAKKLKERYKAHPYLIVKLNREKQEYYENNPEARKRLLEYFNRGQRKIPAKNHTIVKSKGEKLINDVLFDSGILPNYETIELNFPEIDPIPDFYPRGVWQGEKIRNVIVEYYGGHPKSYQSKIRKNEAYKKYKIPVLILTPYELKLPNFSEYLLNQLVKLSMSKEARKPWLKKWRLREKK